MENMYTISTLNDGINSHIIYIQSNHALLISKPYNDSVSIRCNVYASHQDYMQFIDYLTELKINFIDHNKLIDRHLELSIEERDKLLMLLKIYGG